MASMAILTSLASIFLPTYSGVRPTIRPATNTATMTNSSMPYMPAPTPPTMTSPSWMLISGIMPPSAVKLSCMALTAPQEAAVVTTANRAGRDDAEADLLAFHIAAGQAHGRECVVAGGFRPIGDGHADTSTSAAAPPSALRPSGRVTVRTTVAGRAPDARATRSGPARPGPDSAAATTR